MANEHGKVIQVTGPVVDVEFPPGSLPEIYTALRLSNPSIDAREGNLVLEVALHLGENTVRCVAMDSTDGLMRGQVAANTGKGIEVPVGKAVQGHREVPGTDRRHHHPEENACGGNPPGRHHPAHQDERQTKDGMLELYHPEE